MGFMDPSLDDTHSSCKLIRCMKIALLCVQENANDRPSMLEVFSMLKSENNDVKNPKKPTYFSRKKEDEERKGDSSSVTDGSKGEISSESCSINSVTISQIVSR